MIATTVNLYKLTLIHDDNNHKSCPLLYLIIFYRCAVLYIIYA